MSKLALTARRYSNRALRFVTRGMTAIHEGFWLGLLTHEELNSTTASEYASDAGYVDPAHNEYGLYDWEQRAIEAWFPSSGRLLVGAVGGGREALALSLRGYDLTCFECAPRLLENTRALLRDHGREAVVIPAEPDSVPAVSGQFDGLIMGWGAYTHIRGTARRVAFLRALRAVAAPGAPLVVSFYSYRDATRMMTASNGVARIVHRLTRRGELPEFGDAINEGYYHRFTRDEVESELAAAGFERVHFSDMPFAHAVARAA